VALALSLALFKQLGGEFIPTLDEGDLGLEIYRVVGTGMDQAVKMQEPFEKALLELPEVKLTFGRLGTAEVATDPMSPNQGDEFVILKPEKEWPNPKKPKAQLIEEVDARVKQVVGTGVEIEQPVQLRANELIAGVKSDMAVKIFGDDVDVLKETGENIRAVLAKNSGRDGAEGTARGGPAVPHHPTKAQTARALRTNLGRGEGRGEDAVGRQKGRRGFEG